MDKNSEYLFNIEVDLLVLPMKIVSLLFKALLIQLAFFSSTEIMTAQKIYINTDLEGISGVFKFDQTREKDTPLNIQACEYFMDDLAAVIQGLHEAGITDITVLDGHGTQCIIPHMMVPGAKYVTGKPRPVSGPRCTSHL